MDKLVIKAVRCYLIHDDKIVCIQYQEHIPIKGYYDIPGGKIENGETPEQAAIREMKEETGLTVKNLKYKGNMIIEYPNKIYDLETFITSEWIGTTHEFDKNQSQWMEINELIQKDKFLSTIIILKEPYIKGLLDDKCNFKMNINVDEQENILNVDYKMSNLDII